MEIRCLFPDRNTNSLLDCDRELPLGAELQYRCQRLFTFDKVPQQSGHMTCGEHGQWMKLIEFKEFQCLPGIFLVAQTELEMELNISNKLEEIN